MIYPLHQSLTVNQCFNLLNEIRKAFSLDKPNITYIDCADYFRINTDTIPSDTVSKIIGIFDPECVHKINVNRIDIDEPILIKQPDF